MNKTYFAVTGIIRFREKILILKKADDDRNYPGYWSFCSGFVKEFEAGEDTVLREIKEEAGLDGKIDKKGEVIHVKDETIGKNWIVLPFLCSVDSDKIKLDHENSEYRWIGLNEIEKYKFVPSVVEALKSVGIL